MGVCIRLKCIIPGSEAYVALYEHKRFGKMGMRRYVLHFLTKERDFNTFRGYVLKSLNSTDCTAFIEQCL